MINVLINTLLIIYQFPKVAIVVNPPVKHANNQLLLVNFVLVDFICIKINVKVTVQIKPQ